MVAIAVIPARSGSKSVKDKNLQPIGGASLLELAIKSARESQVFARIICSTDSEYYAELATGFGAEVPYLRPSELASDESSDMDVFSDLCYALKLDEATLIGHLRPTTPMRDPKVIQQAFETFLPLKSQFSALRSVEEMSESAFKTFCIGPSGNLMPAFRELDLHAANMPRQAFAKTFSANGYVDLLKVETIMTGTLHGHNCLAFETERTIEIDSLADLELARAVYAWKTRRASDNE
jgi:N-acylneuraminate cytidylyltransferase